MTTDRELLLDLVETIESGDPIGVALRIREVRQHLAETLPCDCSTEAARASRASYAAGVARGVGARPDRRQGDDSPEGDPPTPDVSRV